MFGVLEASHLIDLLQTFHPARRGYGNAFPCHSAEFSRIEPTSVLAFIQSTKVVEWDFGVEAPRLCHEFPLTVASVAYDEDVGSRIVFVLRGLISLASLGLFGQTRMLGIGIKYVMKSSIS